VEPHEVERAIQFLLAQQAQFAADLQQSRELGDQRHAELTRAILGLTSIAGALVETDERLGRRLDSIAIKHEELAAAHKELAAAHKETEAALTSLMLVVEKYFRERSNGGPH